MSELMKTFETSSPELYWLAYLLTGNEDRSVQAFTRALDLEEETNLAFDGFMNQWARKLIMVAALGTIESDLRRSIARVARLAEAPGGVNFTQRHDIAKEEFEQAVIAIDAFPRCAMLLTTFEGLSIPAAAILLNAEEGITAKAQRIGVVQLTRNLSGDSGRDFYPGLAPVPVLSHT
jgi:DNA-directed RNA polymerase specialized sigma24 family protein